MDLGLILYFVFIAWVILMAIYKFINYKGSEKKILNKVDKPESWPYTMRGKTTEAPKIKHDNWTYNDRNLQKALLKGRRRGHLRIMYHGEWYPTGLKTVTV